LLAARNAGASPFNLAVLKPCFAHADPQTHRDLDRADYETTIADLMAGQHSDPLRVVRFNTDTDRAEVSQAIAQEILRRLDFEGRNVLSELEGVIDRHVGRDRGWPNT
jgi:hypothetical protein